MSGLTKPIDVTRPEDYQLRDGKEVIGLFKRERDIVLVIYKKAPDIAGFSHVDARGWSWPVPENGCDLIEKPKKMWRNMCSDYGYEAWCNSRAEADFVAKYERIGYLTCTDPDDFSTYELVPLEGEI